MGRHAPAISAARRIATRWAPAVAAVPVLTAATVAVLVTGGGSSADPAAGRPDAAPRHLASPVAAVEPVTVTTTADTSPCAVNTHGQFTLVSITKQHAWMCDKHRQVYSTPVTTGARGLRTPTGTWNVQSRQRNRYLTGADYRDYVKYWVPFNGDYGFHDASWQRMPYGSPDYRQLGSHGCVHLPLPAMEWFYHWATVGGTTVTVRH